MTISLIVAMTPQRVIGLNSQLPWHLSADLRRFRKLTMGKTIVMGRKTYESIGRPLDGRDNVVITRQPDYHAKGITVRNSVEQTIEGLHRAEETMIIGGETIYQSFLPFANRIYQTIVDADIAGDTLFPQLDPTEWIETERETHAADQQNPYKHHFLILEKAP